MASLLLVPVSALAGAAAASAALWDVVPIVVVALLVTLYGLRGRIDQVLAVAIPSVLPALLTYGVIARQGSDPAVTELVTLCLLILTVELALEQQNDALDAYRNGRLETARAGSGRHWFGYAAAGCLVLVFAAGGTTHATVAVPGIIGLASSLLVVRYVTAPLNRRLLERAAARLDREPEASIGSPRFWRELLELYSYRGPYVESYLTWKLRLDPIYRGIDALVPTGGTILDVGCGYGLMAHILARAGRSRQVMGIDFDAPKIDVARATVGHRPDPRFVCGDMHGWTFPPARAVLLIDVLHYWEPERQRALIGRACGCLEGPDAVLVFRDACAVDAGRHRLTAWLERFSTTFGFNRRGHGLRFQPLEFYLEAFAAEGFVPASRHPELARGSNQVIVFRRGERPGLRP